MTLDQTNPDAARAATVHRMMWYFAIVYIAEGWAQSGGVIKQPLYHYLYGELQWTSAQVGAYMWWLGIPWWIKPLYGLLSDSRPLFGYRRKTYLLLANVIALLAYLTLGFSSQPLAMLPSLIAIVAMMAFSSALCGALVVDMAKHAHDENHSWQKVVRSNVASVGAAGTSGWLFQYFVPLDALPNAHMLVLGGEMMGGLLLLSACVAVTTALYQRFAVDHATHAPLASKYCGQQALWASMASVLAAFTGGWLSQKYLPLEGLHMAAFIAIIPIVLVIAVTWPLVREEKAVADGEHFRQGLTAIKQALFTKELWAVAGFLMLWAFNPAFSSVMYEHMDKHLHFTQLEIGQLSGYYAIGMACGALFYMKVLSRMFSVRTLALGIILIGGSTQLGFIWMADPTTGMYLNLLNGFMTAMAGVNAHVIAANRCPDHAEGFMYSCLLSASNLSWSTSDWIGGVIYTHLLQGQIFWLIVGSSVATFACLGVLSGLRVERQLNTQPPAH
jgi:MFS family permease